MFQIRFVIHNILFVRYPIKMSAQQKPKSIKTIPKKMSSGIYGSEFSPIITAN